MPSCTYEYWSVKDIASALTHMHSEQKDIVVPTFQRGKRWKSGQETEFIDSLQKGFPVGTMLFYRTVRDQREIYTLVDGLQRGNTIKKFISQPTKYFFIDSIDPELINSIFSILGFVGNEGRIKNDITNVFLEAIQGLNSFNNIQYYDIAKKIADEFPSTTVNVIDNIITAIKPFLMQQEELFEKIEKATVPVIVYTGQEETLPEIFERINSKGTPLSLYEIYAASWPVDNKFRVDNSQIVSYVMRKYDLLEDDNYTIEGYNRDDLRRNQMLNAFEYAFGFGKYICNEFAILSFDKNKKDDVINPLGFELLNACLRESKDDMSSLFNVILQYDMNQVESRIVECIRFVEKVINPVTRFKGNNRGSEKTLHAKYQALSMVAATFKEKYNLSDLSQAKREWNEKKAVLQNNMMHHFVFDIIRKEWYEGGAAKVFSYARPNRYLNPISTALWETTLNSYYEKSSSTLQVEKVPNPKNEDLVFLNCIYMSLFSASEQLSTDSFDVEHIATKNLMKGLIKKCGGNGLPISSIANLCYLPETVNRSKGNKTFYQDQRYLNHVELQTVEQKFSFTKREDLEWTELDYSNGDFETLKSSYRTFLLIRFKRQKEIFYQSMGIEIHRDDTDEIEILPEIDTTDGYTDISGIFEPRAFQQNRQSSPSTFHEDCASRISTYLNTPLQKKSKKIYESADKQVGVVLSVSKTYTQGEREKYWFGYQGTTIEVLSEYQDKYVAFGCGSADNIVIMPLNEIEKAKLRLNYTDDSSRIYWHIVFYKSIDGVWTWQLSKPDVVELNIDDKLINLRVTNG